MKCAWPPPWPPPNKQDRLKVEISGKIVCFRKGDILHEEIKVYRRANSFCTETGGDGDESCGSLPEDGDFFPVKDTCDQGCLGLGLCKDLREVLFIIMYGVPGIGLELRRACTAKNISKNYFPVTRLVKFTRHILENSLKIYWLKIICPPWRPKISLIY